jgi:hypothetical protein
MAARADEDRDEEAATDWQMATDADITNFVRENLSEEQFEDMDESLTSAMSQSYSPGGTNFVPPGESIGRLVDPLTDEQKSNFGDIALRALHRVDLG